MVSQSACHGRRAEATPHFWRSIAITTARSTIASTNITAIGTGYQWSGRRDPFGNMFAYAGQITLTHGRREAYDVYFLAAN